MECVEKIIKKDMIHPLTSEKIAESDIIPLQRVGYEVISVEEIVIISITISGRYWIFDD